MTTVQVDTPHGQARAHVHCVSEGRAALLLGHGAGGGIDAVDLVAAARAARDAGVHVALVEQPYRVAGRRAPSPAGMLDTAFLSVADALAGRYFGGMPMVFGGRSSGARVACRTQEAGQAVAVLALAFPVHPPGRPERSRQQELDEVAVPTLIVQGATDPFGTPVPAAHQELAVLAGNHALKADPDGITRVVADWLDRVLRPLER
ncbi:MAG: alpha/beta hydrolase family protein [Sciscionella sp.]